MLFPMSVTAPTFAERRAAVERAGRRARQVVWAVLLSGLLNMLRRTDALACVVRGAEGCEAGGAAVRVAVVLPYAVQLAAASLFLLWLYRAVSNARDLGVPLPWGPGQSALAFLVPIVSLVLPYYVMKALYRASDPSTLPDAPRFRERTDAGYREGAREPLPPPTWTSPAPILAWWVLFDAVALSGLVIPSGTGGAAVEWVVASFDAAASVLCALVVRSIDARQRERCRRLEASESVVSP
jgi:hypothetical protein